MQNLFAIFKQYRLVIIITILLILGTSGVLLYFLSSSPISVTNSSKYYSVSYQETLKFKTVLEQWGLWEKSKIYLEKGEAARIKKIEFVFTDKEQRLIKEYDDKKNVLWSSDINIKNANTLVVLIQLNPIIFSDPLYKDNKNRNLDKLLTSISLNILYTSTHDPFVTNKSDTSFRSLIIDFMQHTDNFPFHIRINKSL